MSKPSFNKIAPATAKCDRGNFHIWDVLHTLNGIPAIKQRPSDCLFVISDTLYSGIAENRLFGHKDSGYFIFQLHQFSVVDEL